MNSDEIEILKRRAGQGEKKTQITQDFGISLKLSLVVSTVALSGVASLGILACVFAGILAPAFALSLAIAVYAANSMID